MPRSGFYNQNLYRDYPFQTQWEPPRQLRSHSSESSVSGESYATAALPHEVIVDFGCIMGLEGGYVDRWDWVYLYRITRSDPFLTFEFRTTANQQVLRFTRRIDDPEYKYEWVDGVWRWDSYELPTPSSPSSASLPSSAGQAWLGCEAWKPRWEGFLVTGRFEELLDLIPDGEALYFDSGYQVVEPARIQNLKESYVRSINLANRARTRTFPPEACRYGESASAPFIIEQDENIHQYVACMQGALTFVEGYNCQIRQEDATNTIVIGAGVGLGAGEVCEEFRFYPSESKGSDTLYYTFGDTCERILKTLNGRGGRQIRFEAGPGFTVRTSPVDPSTIIVDMTLEDFAICLEPVGAEQSSSSAGGP